MNLMMSWIANQNRPIIKISARPANFFMDYNICKESYQRLCDFMLKNTGITLGDHKEYLIHARLFPLMTRLGLASLDEVLLKLDDPENPLKEKVIELITTHETYWFRDKYPFELLTTHFLPYFASKRTERPIVSIWSCGCSLGQEPYSIAMTIEEFKKNNPQLNLPIIKILATELSKDIIDCAKEGLYDEFSLKRGLPEDFKQNYFVATEHAHFKQLHASIRDKVEFMLFNLLDPFEFPNKFDLIFCRNVLIYFSQNLRNEILLKFYAQLYDDGALILGGTESIGCSQEAYAAVQAQDGIYFKKNL